MKRERVWLALVVLLGAAACASPEATRARGGGPGADPGNRGAVEMHGGAKMYYRTPCRLPTSCTGPAPVFGT